MFENKEGCTEHSLIVNHNKKSTIILGSYFDVVKFENVKKQWQKVSLTFHFKLPNKYSTKIKKILN